MQASDWDGNGVGVPAGSIEFSRGDDITDSNNRGVRRTHTGIADDARHKVKGTPDSNPSFRIGCCQRADLYEGNGNNRFDTAGRHRR